LKQKKVGGEIVSLIKMASLAKYFCFQNLSKKNLGFGTQVETLKGILSKLSRLSNEHRENEVGRVSRQVMKSIIAQSTSKGAKLELPTNDLLSEELQSEHIFQANIRESLPDFIKLDSLFPPTMLKSADVDEMDQMLMNMIAYTLNVAGIRDVTAEVIGKRNPKRKCNFWSWVRQINKRESWKWEKMGIENGHGK